MRTKIFMTAMMALTLIVGNAGCNGKGDNVDVPAGMHEVTYQGFTFLCPDVLKPAKQLGSDETASNLFMLDEIDITNALMCEVKDLNAEFTREAGEQLAKEMQTEESGNKVEYKMFDDGLLIKATSNNPSLSSETIYTAMRMLCKGQKAFTVTFMYSEKNKAALSKYVDAVMNSVKAVE